MLRRINVDTFLKPLGLGISRPVLVVGDDNERYVLKNQKSDSDRNLCNFDCMFLNELLAYQIGKYLEVPMPEAVIAYLDSQLIDADPEMRFAYRFTEGTHFASKELKNVENNLKDNLNTLKAMGKPYINRSWNHFFKNIVNKEDIAKILAFDLLISNCDRYGNEGNILVDNTVDGRMIFAIDHGHAFEGSGWADSKISLLKSVEHSQQYINTYINRLLNINVKNGYLNGLGIIFRELETYIDLNDVDTHSFQDVIMKIETISEEHLDSWLKDIPDEWFVNKSMQIAYYKKFILDQKMLIRYFIQMLANREAFSNFRGGILKWKTEKQYGTA